MNHDSAHCASVISQKKTPSQCDVDRPNPYIQFIYFIIGRGRGGPPGGRGAPRGGRGGMRIDSASPGTGANKKMSFDD